MNNDSQLARNLSLLRTHRPELAAMVEPLLGRPAAGRIITGRDGSIDVEFITPGGSPARLYATRAPAEAIADCLDAVGDKEGQFIVILGLGLGHEVLAVCRQHSRLNRILIIEPSVDFFILGLRHLDLADLIANANVQLAIGASLADLDPLILSLDRWHLLQAPPFILSLLHAHQTDPDFFATASDKLYRLLNSQYLHSWSSITSARLMVDNAFANFSSIVADRPLDSLKSLYQGRPAIIVGAGPSLKKNIHLLRQAAGKAVLFVVDSAVKKMLDQGVAPHFVVAMDPRERNADALWGRWDELAASALIYLNSVTPLIVKLFTGERVYAFDEAPINDWFNEMSGSQEPVGHLASVSLLALTAARCLGCGPIILVGQDLSGNATEPSGDDCVPVPGNTRDTVYTSHDFLYMIERFEAELAKGDTKVINATEGGVRLRHAEPMTLADALAGLPEAGPLPQLPAVAERAGKIQKCLRHLDETAGYLKMLQQQCEEMTTQADWAWRQISDGIKHGGSLYVSDRLANAVNNANAIHHAMAGDRPAPEHARFGPILDLLMGEKRLAAHAAKIAWRKKHPEAATPGTAWRLLEELEVHRTLGKAMRETAEFLLAKIETSRARLLLHGKEEAAGEEETAAWLFGRAGIYLASGDLMEARDDYSRVLAIRPDDPAAHFGLGEIALKLRETRQALDHFNAARRGNNGYGERIAPLLASFSEISLDAAKDRIARKRPGARRYLEDLLPGFPGHEEARRLLAAMQGNIGAYPISE